MANGSTRNTITLITDEDIDALKSVLSDLKAGATDAKGKGNLPVFRVYQSLVKLVSPEVVRIEARKERQELARMEKDAKALKDAQPINSSTER